MREKLYTYLLKDSKGNAHGTRETREDARNLKRRLEGFTNKGPFKITQRTYALVSEQPIR